MLHQTLSSIQRHGNIFVVILTHNFLVITSNNSVKICAHSWGWLKSSKLIVCLFLSTKEVFGLETSSGCLINRVVGNDSPIFGGSCGQIERGLKVRLVKGWEDEVAIVGFEFTVDVLGAICVDERVKSLSIRGVVISE